MVNEYIKYLILGDVLACSSCKKKQTSSSAKNSRSVTSDPIQDTTNSEEVKNPACKIK